MDLLHNLILRFCKVKLLAFLNHINECRKNCLLLHVSSLFLFADLSQKISLTVNLLGEIVFEILVFGVLVKFFYLRITDHSIKLLRIGVCNFDRLYHFRQDYLAEL